MTLKGSTTEFPLDVLLRLLADTKKTGELTLRGQKGEGALGLAEGRVVTAMYADEKPIPALGFIWELGDVDFEFTPWNDSPPANLEGNLDENLKRADEYAKWRADVRSVIPHDGIRFRLSERAADQGAVTFTSDRWRVVMAVNTRPSVSELASNLHIDRDDALTTLAGLVRDGVIDTIDEPAPAPASKPAPGPPPAAEMTSAPAYEPAPEPAARETPSEDWTAALVRRAESQPEPLPEAPRAEAPQSAPRVEATPAPPPPSPAPSSDAWSSMPVSAAPPPEPTAPAPMPDWSGAPASPSAQWTPTPVAPAAPDWNAVPAPAPAPEAPPPMAEPPDWTSSPASQDSSSQPWTQAPPPPPDWTSSPVAPPPSPTQPARSEPASFAPAADAWGAPQPSRAEPAPSANDWAAAPSSQAAPPASDWGAPTPAEPQPIDDRLAALQGMFNTPAPAQNEQAQWTAPAADTWTTPQAASAPSAPAEDPRLAAMSAPPPPAAPEKTAKPNEWAPPPTIGAPQQKKGGGLFGGLFGGKKASASEGASPSGNGGGSRAGKLAAFSNALLSEYTSGSYGKGKVDERMPSLLMRVDEQADPIDRPLPVVDDRLDVQALERVQIAENQAVPYLATLVSTIYSDAEKAFGKEKAKRGYKAAQQQIFGADAAALSGPDIAGKLPKV